MYKICTLAEFSAINEAQNAKEPGSQYCEMNKHCTDELYAIPIITSILQSHNLPFITENWLTSDLLETLPNDWNWHHLEQIIRLKVDKKKLTNDMLANNNVGQLVNYALNDANIKQHIIDSPEAEFLYIYLSFLLPEHDYIIQNSTTIEIEYYESQS